MPTPKENFLRLMKNDSPKWLGDPWSCFTENPIFRPIAFDAISLMLGGPRPGQLNVKNLWGVTFDWPAGDPGAIPIINDANKVVKDIAYWKDFIKFPDISHAPWGMVKESIINADRENYLLMAPSFTGMFEFSHYVMGFEDALMNYLLEPEHMYDLLSAYTDWKIEAIKQVIDNMQPDIIHSHDDWGNKKSLFMKPETWREMIKPHYERFYGYIKSRGVLIQHHADCVCHEVCEDMVDLGIDMWQGVIPQNNIEDVIRRTEGKLSLLGGFDMQEIDFPNCSEQKIKDSVRHVIDTYMPYGSFIPCVTNIIPINKHVELILNAELNNYGAQYAQKHFK